MIENLFLAPPKEGHNHWTVGWQENGTTERQTFNNKEDAQKIYNQIKKREGENQ